MIKPSKKAQKIRRPLSNEQLEKLHPGEAYRLKLTEDESFRLREINKQRDVDRQASVERMRLEAAPLLAELQGAGLKIKTLGGLVTTLDNHVVALPILINHLQKPYSDKIKSTIARSLAVPDSHVYWQILVAEYRKAPQGKGIAAIGDTKEFSYGAKDGLAVALALACNDETLPELISLTKDQSLGDSRILLLLALKRRRKKNLLVKEVLDELVHDPQLRTEITSWKKL